MTRRPSRPRAYAPDPAAPGRSCDMPSCDAPASTGRRSRARILKSYWWFCLEHVRAYNAAWDYYKGMTPGRDRGAAALRYLMAAPVLASGPARLRGLGRGELRDPLAALASGRVARGGNRASEKTPQDLREPLATMGLSWPTTLEAVKSRYKELAKRHHPDANGGSRAAEERLKVINLAYAALRSGSRPTGLATAAG